jgi:glutamine synthetase
MPQESAAAFGMECAESPGYLHEYTETLDRETPKMAMTPDDVLKLIKDKEVKFVDLRFTDTRGKEQHVTVPVKYFTKDKFEAGHAFDGSSIAGWKGIQASDMLLMPEAGTARMDPFTDEPVLNITCDVYEPMDGKPYDRDPRSRPT